MKTLCQVSYISHKRTNKNDRDRKYNVFLQEMGEGKNRELVFNEDRVSVCKDEKALEMDGGDGYTTKQVHLTPPDSPI